MTTLGVGDTVTLTGVVRTVSDLTADGSLRVTIDVEPDRPPAECRHHIPLSYYCPGCGGTARRDGQP